MRENLFRYLYVKLKSGYSWKENTGFVMRHFVQIFLPVFVLLIFSFITVFQIIIPLLEKKYMLYKHEMCRNLVDLAMSDLYSRQREVNDGTISLSMAQQRAINRFRNYRFGDDARDYYWFQGPDAIIIMHPYRPDLEGQNPDHILAPDGRILTELYRDLFNAAKNPSGGYLEYQWYWKENLDVIKNKVSFVKIFEPWGWLIGTGVYIDDIEEDMAEWRNTFIKLGLFLTSLVAVFALFLSFRGTRFKQREIEALKKLQANEDKFRSIFNYSPYGIAINSLPDGRYLSVNPAFESFTGYQESELKSRTWNEFHLAPDDIETGLLVRVRDQGKVYNIESAVKTKFGDNKNILYTAAEVEIDGDAALVSLIVDIIEQKKLEEGMRHSQKMDVIGQLTGGIAHDFNNMLAGIMGSAEILGLKIQGNPDLIRHVDLIIKSSNRAAELIKKLLTFARKGMEVSASLDMHDIINESIVILERSIDRKIVIETGLSAENSIVRGDPSLLQNVIMNLGLNARDAMPEGGVIAIRTSNIIIDKAFCDNRHYRINPGKYIEIHIEDSGLGMNSEIMKRVFEPFFTTKQVGKGTGLGLSVVYGTVKEHGGIIEVYSEPGSGTVFKVYLPVTDKASKGIVYEADTAVSGEGCILVVDDEEIVRTIASALLESLGYECLFAENGSAALDVYKREKERIDLVLLDIIMPGISGVDTFYMLKKIDENVKVVLSSGFRKDEKIKDLYKAGLKGFIQKPYHLIELSRIISGVITSSGKS